MTNALAPFIGPPGLQIVINSGQVIINGNPLTIPGTKVSLSADSRTYIYLDYNTGNIVSNITGFLTSNIYPIAIVDTTSSSVSVLIDSRSDVPLPAPSSSNLDSIQNLNTSQVVGFGGTTNTLILGTSSSSNIVFTLPPATGFSGRFIKIKKVDSGVGTINIVGFIDDLSAYLLTNLNQYIILESDNNVWQIVGNN